MKSPVVTLCVAIINACFVGDSDTVKTGRISQERELFRNLNANRKEVTEELGDSAKENEWAVMVITTLGSGHHEYGNVLKAAQRIARAIELPGLLAQAAHLEIPVRNPRGIPVHMLEQMIVAKRKQLAYEQGQVARKRDDLLRQTRNLNTKARELVIELRFLSADLSDVPAIVDPDEGIGNAELVAAREVADRLETALREKREQHVSRLRKGRFTELFGDRRSSILLRGTHDVKGDLERAAREVERQVDDEMRALWEKFQASRKRAQATQAAAPVATQA